MKVCMVTPIIIPSKEGAFSGGHTNSLIQLAKALSEAGHQIYVISGIPVIAFENLNKLELQKMSLCPIPIKKKPHTIGYSFEFILRAFLLIRKLHKSEGLDIVHVHSGYPYYGFLSYATKRLCKLPSVYTLYCPISHEVVDVEHPAMNIRLARYALSKINSIIAISRNVRDSLLKIGISKEKIDVIPPPINIEKFNPDCDKGEFKLQFQNNWPILLFVGNLTKTKGIDILIDALPPVISKYPKVKLVMALDVQEKLTDYEFHRMRELKKKINQIGIKENIMEVGLVQNIQSLMAVSDVVVTPFLSTSGPADYPISVLEAMAVGRPVIATQVGGIPEVIESGKNGILIKPGDANELAQNILVLLKNPKLQKGLGTNAAYFIANQFNLNKIANKVQNLYEKVLNPVSKGEWG